MPCYDPQKRPFLFSKIVHIPAYALFGTLAYSLFVFASNNQFFFNTYMLIYRNIHFYTESFPAHTSKYTNKLVYNFFMIPQLNNIIFFGPNTHILVDIRLLFTWLPKPTYSFSALTHPLYVDVSLWRLAENNPFYCRACLTQHIPDSRHIGSMSKTTNYIEHFNYY